MPKILIVEDEKVLRDILVIRFQNEGFDVFSAEDGGKGLVAALEKKPDIILLDIMMPNVSGLDMLKQLRQYNVGKDMKVIITTNSSDNKLLREAMELGAKDYLIKVDWVLSEIVDSVRKQLEGN